MGKAKWRRCRCHQPLVQSNGIRACIRCDAVAYWPQKEGREWKPVPVEEPRG